MEEDPFDPQGLFSRPPPPSQQKVAPSVTFPATNPPSFSFQPPQNGFQQPITPSTTFPVSNPVSNKPIPPVPQKPTTKPTGNYNITIDNIVSTPSLPVPNTIGRSNSNPGTVTSNQMPTLGQTEPSRLQPMPSITSLTQPNPIQNSSSDSSLFSYDKAAELISLGYQRLEKGMFLEALEAVNQSIKVLGLCKDPISVKKELKACSNYKLLLQLLLEIKKSEQNIAKSAYLTTILAEVPAQPKHHLVCTRMAINKNLDAKNFRVASILIKHLLSFQIVDQAQMMEKLKLCEDNGNINTNSYPYACPFCNANTDASNVICLSCNSKALYCYQSHTPIAQSFYHQCTICDSIFTNQITQSGQRCSFCAVGTLTVTQVTRAPSSIQRAKTPEVPSKPNTLVPPPEKPRSNSNGQTTLPKPEVFLKPEVPKKPEIPTFKPMPEVPPKKVSEPPQKLVESPRKLPIPLKHVEPPKKVPEKPVENIPRKRPDVPARRPNDLLTFSGSNEEPTPNTNTSKPMPPPKFNTMRDQRTKPPQKESEEAPKPEVAKLFPYNVPPSNPPIQSFPTTSTTFPTADTAFPTSFPTFTEEPVKLPSLPQKLSPTTSFDKGLPPLPKKDSDSNLSSPPPILQKPVSKSISAPDESTFPERSQAQKSQTLPASLSSNLTVPEYSGLLVITPSERENYTQEFKKADINGDGFMDGNEAKLFFQNSGATKKNLAHIWRLADLDQDSKLDLEEFIIAMHLLTAVLLNEELPAKLPIELVPPSKPNRRSLPKAAPPPPVPPKGLDGPAITAPPPLPKEAPPTTVVTIPPKELPTPPTKKKADTFSDYSSSDSESVGHREASRDSSPTPKRNVDKADKKAEKERKKEEKEKKKQEEARKKEEEKLKKEEEKKLKTLRKKEKFKPEEEEKPAPTPTLNEPPILSAAPEISKKKDEEEENLRNRALSAPPPTLFTPPMLPNVIATEKPLPAPSLFTPPIKSTTAPPPLPRSEAPRSTTPPFERPLPPPPLPRDDQSETSSESNSPPPQREETPKPPPIVVAPQPLLKPQVNVKESSGLRQDELYTVKMQGRIPPKKDYLSGLPVDVRLSVDFLEKLLKQQDFTGCFSMFSSNLQNRVSLAQLEQLGKYYGGLGGLWYCQAIAYRSDHVVIYVPLHFSEKSFQMKMWVLNNTVEGLEFSPYDEEKWNDEGVKEKYVVNQPKIVKLFDGSTKEIHSPKEELDCLSDGKTPLGIQVKEEKKVKILIKTFVEVKQKKPTLKVKAKDGKSYFVWSELSYNQQTIRGHPQGYVREYWAPEKDEANAFCYILDKLGNRVSDELYAELNDGEVEVFSTLKKDRKKQIAKKAIPQIERFYVCFPVPPELHSQSIDLINLRGIPNIFIGADKRAFILSISAGDKKSPFEIEFEVTLRTTSLTPRYEGLNFVQELNNLSNEEKKIFLKPTPEFEFMEKYWQDWLAARSLIAGIFGYAETPLQFAYRVYVDLVKSFEYQVPTDPKQSEVLRTRRGDAEALSRIYVGILRSNEIPARVLRGRLAQTKKSGQFISWIGGQTEIEDDLSHTISQFHVDDVGWITVDIANYVRNKNPNFHEGKLDSYIGGFGREPGNFVATCIDKPFVEIPVLGPRADVHHNDFTVFFDHKKKGATDWIIL